MFQAEMIMKAKEVVLDNYKLYGVPGNAIVAQRGISAHRN